MRTVARSISFFQAPITAADREPPSPRTLFAIVRRRHLHPPSSVGMEQCAALRPQLTRRRLDRDERLVAPVPLMRRQRQRIARFIIGEAFFTCAVAHRQRDEALRGTRRKRRRVRAVAPVGRAKKSRSQRIEPPGRLILEHGDGDLARQPEIAEPEDVVRPGLRTSANGRLPISTSLATIAGFAPERSWENWVSRTATVNSASRRSNRSIRGTAKRMPSRGRISRPVSLSIATVACSGNGVVGRRTNVSTPCGARLCLSSKVSRPSRKARYGQRAGLRIPFTSTRDADGVSGSAVTGASVLAGTPRATPLAISAPARIRYLIGYLKMGPHKVEQGPIPLPA